MSSEPGKGRSTSTPIKTSAKVTSTNKRKPQTPGPKHVKSRSAAYDSLVHIWRAREFDKVPTIAEEKHSEHMKVDGQDDIKLLKPKVVHKRRYSGSEVEAKALHKDSPDPLSWPENKSDVSMSLVQQLIDSMFFYGDRPQLLQQLLPEADATRLVNQLEETLKEEPNVVTVRVPVTDAKVIVVGDLHGQFYDLHSILSTHGYPSESLSYVFNGDFVDRGSWGVEVCFTLFAMKILWPQFVHLTRGNHETNFCTLTYGFFNESVNKYSSSLYSEFSFAFCQIPIAAIIVPDIPSAGIVPEKSIVSNGVGLFVLHGGLFRGKVEGHGTIQDLMSCDRVQRDPENNILEEVLWSDPQYKAGIGKNTMRGAGIFFGPDITASFLKHHGLSMIVRSHEGPDARVKRPHVQRVNDMMNGYAVDHKHNDGTPSLVTLFSAPNYPQGPNAANNDACVMSVTFEQSEDDIKLRWETHRYSAATIPDLTTYLEKDTNAC